MGANYLAKNQKMGVNNLAKNLPKQYRHSLIYVVNVRTHKKIWKQKLHKWRFLVELKEKKIG
jgi:hypothetical protein